jgi:hypothetical protein
MINTKLLCTFVNKRDIENRIDDILDTFNDVDRLFIFMNRDRENDFYITFNIDTAKNSIYENYIAIHRKKETNTLYSVNALNIIIRNLNNNILDKSYKIDWTIYENVLLLTRNSDVNRIPLVLDEVVRVN